MPNSDLLMAVAGRLFAVAVEAGLGFAAYSLARDVTADEGLMPVLWRRLC
jgi:hypothetical protein